MADDPRDGANETNAGNAADLPPFEEVMNRHEPALLRYVARLLNNADTAREVGQETFIRLHRRWGPNGPKGDHLLSWLYRTAHNVAVDFIRREERRRRLHERAANEMDRSSSAAPAGVGDHAERRRLVLGHVAQLSPGERKVLLLRLQEGLSYPDISRATGHTRSATSAVCFIPPCAGALRA